jgi:hypothetical protein
MPDGNADFVLLAILLSVAALGLALRTWLLPAHRGSVVIALSTGRQRDRTRPTVDRSRK